METFFPEAWLPYIGCIIAVFAAIAVILPAPKEKSYKIYCYFYKFVQWVALNKGQAKNANDAEK